MISTITLEGTLPQVFRGSEADAPVCCSQVWLQPGPGLALTRPGAYIVEAESGTGKSSLCAYIYGERTDYDGRILFDGEDIAHFDIQHWCRLRREALAYLPQDMRLFSELSVMDNIQLKNRLTGTLDEAGILERLERLGLRHKAHEPAGRLSIGQQQRVAVVRALCQPFDFLLLDEPVSHLDQRNNRAVAELIAAEAASRGAAIVATSVGNRLALPGCTHLKL